MKKPSAIGKNHVLQVSAALKQSLEGKSITTFSEPIIQTVRYIEELYPHIQSFLNKFEMDRPDTQPDLLLTLADDQEVRMKLFSIQGLGAIQPKNLGAKSFLETYFDSPGLQTYFNDYFDELYKAYLQSILSLNEKVNVYDQIRMLKKKVRQVYPRFVEDINEFRNEFLFSLREHCFTLLKDEYNVGAIGIERAFNELMLMDYTAIITRYSGKNECLGVERWKSAINSEKGIQIYKKGNDTVGIRSGEESLTLRFKFESGPISSIKLATSYEVFPTDDVVVHDNLRSIKNFETLIVQHTYLKDKSKSNAIGKCNEAMVYYGILKANPSIHQVKEQDYQHMLQVYAPEISHEELLDIQTASVITAEKINGYLAGKFSVYEIEEIQLVADSYLKDRLDTSDLQLVLKVGGKYVVEPFSLKATAQRNRKITMKNPGIGQILGPRYFGIGSLFCIVEEAKKQFEQEQLNHKEVLEQVSGSMGESLKSAEQQQLREGTAALLGKSTTVLTMYSLNESFILEHTVIKDDIEVHPKTPTPIQTTLRWNDGNEELALRVKFSAGQKHGWSSLKLSCEYTIV